MAPQTNIGSATRFHSSRAGTFKEKRWAARLRNDAVAYVRALARGSHGRNADVAAQMVTKATNTCRLLRVLRVDLVDVIANDQQHGLLRKLDGFQVKGPKSQTESTAGIPVVTCAEVPFQYDLLELLVNLMIAYLLLTAGFGGHRVRVLRPRHGRPGRGASAQHLGAAGSCFYGTSAAARERGGGPAASWSRSSCSVLESKIGGHVVLAVGRHRRPDRSSGPFAVQHGQRRLSHHSMCRW